VHLWDQLFNGVDRLTCDFIDKFYNDLLCISDNFKPRYAMDLTIDEVFIKIGAFRQYQWYLLTFVGYAVLSLSSFPVMIVTFITAEPKWKCVDGYMNNTVCRFNQSITLISDDYKARCKMPREAWTFVDDFTSAVTEVSNV
jgi:hypothetical protein